MAHLSVPPLGVGAVCDRPSNAALPSAFRANAVRPYNRGGEKGFPSHPLYIL